MKFQAVDQIKSLPVEINNLHNLKNDAFLPEEPNIKFDYITPTISTVTESTTDYFLEHRFEMKH